MLLLLLHDVTAVVFVIDFAAVLFVLDESFSNKIKDNLDIILFVYTLYYFFHRLLIFVKESNKKILKIFTVLNTL